MLSRLKSLAAVALGFALFGAGLRVLAFAIIPWIAITSSSKSIRIARTRKVIQAQCARYVKALRALGLIDARFEGFERLKDLNGTLLVANHPTLLDAIFVLARAQNVCCIAKPSLKWILSYRIMIRAAGFILADRSHHLIPRCVERLRSGDNLLIFPEGTRSAEGTIGAFFPGAATIAIRAGSPIVPIYIRSSGPLLLKDRPWFEQPAEMTVVSLGISGDDPLLLRDLPRDERTARGILTKRMEELFSARVG